MLEELNKENERIEGKMKIVEAMSSLSWVMSQNRNSFDEEGVRKGFDDYMLVFLGWLLGWRFKWQSDLVTAKMENSMLKSMLRNEGYGELNEIIGPTGVDSGRYDPTNIEALEITHGN